MILNLARPDLASVRLPADMNHEVATLRQLPSKEKVLRAAYELLSAKYQGFPVGTPLKFSVLFNMDIDSVWHQDGMQYCTNMNYLMEMLLVESGWFTAKDIRRRWTLLRLFSPHQYLQVRVQPNQWVTIDIWGSANGIEFGDYAHGFHLRSKIVTRTS